MSPDRTGTEREHPTNTQEREIRYDGIYLGSVTRLEWFWLHAIRKRRLGGGSSSNQDEDLTLGAQKHSPNSPLVVSSHDSPCARGHDLISITTAMRRNEECLGGMHSISPVSMRDSALSAMLWHALHPYIPRLRAIPSQGATHQPLPDVPRPYNLPVFRVSRAFPPRRSS